MIYKVNPKKNLSMSYSSVSRYNFLFLLGFKEDVPHDVYFNIKNNNHPHIQRWGDMMSHPAAEELWTTDTCREEGDFFFS